MNTRIVKSLVKKDLNLRFKNKFFTAITILGLIFYIIIFFITPKSVDDKMGLAVYSKYDLSRAIISLEIEDVRVVKANSIDEIKKSVSNKDVVAGFVFEDNLKEKASKGEKITMEIYTANDLEPEMKEAINYIGKELVYTELGYGLNIESKNEIIGEDFAGKQIAPSKRMIPVLALLLVLTETLGLANLISDELERKTIHALFAAPVTYSDFFISKGIVGLITTLIPAILFITATVGFKNFGLLFLILLVGSIFTISVGFLAGSVSHDIMSVIAWGALVLIVLILPVMNIMAPGSLTGWVKVIPSYFLSDSLHRVINFGAKLKDITVNMAILLGWGVVLFSLGEFSLRRRFV